MTFLHNYKKDLFVLLKNIIKFCALPWREKGLFTEAFFLTGMVRLIILALPFRWLAPALGKHMQESPDNEDVIRLKAARRIGWIVESVSRFTPWESKCLVQAITGKIMLRQYGIANTLYLGVGKNEQSLVAHSWLRCGKVILTGGHDLRRFTVVGKFADDGRQAVRG
ncbi:MAG: hypothetical protein XD84_0306 [Desulfotomaculum sp. 46_80]|nr:MAG: hypothetical protein XD84_0306 [Desulfotomaculum sp. 46_80]